MNIWILEMILLTFLLKGVWCGDFNISLPEKTEALSGSCVTINCRFDINNTYNRDLNDSVTGVWYKDGHGLNGKIVFNSSSPNNTFKGQIIGKLKDKDCTTMFYNVSLNHSGIFFFRIESNSGLRLNKSASIDIIDSPPKPTVQMFKDQVEVQGEVLEGSSVSLRCSSQTLCSSSPPTLTWSSTDSLSLNGNSSRLQDNPENQTEIISDLNFTVTRLQHGVTFICTIIYQLQTRNTTAQNNITLHVLHQPKISFFSNCVHGDNRVFSCEVHGNPSPIVEWRLSGRPVINSTNTFISEERLNSSVLRSFITLHQSLTHTDTLQCVAINSYGTDSQQIQLLLFPEAKDNHIFSLLIGVAVGASVMMVLCLITHLCARRKNCISSKTTREDTAGLILTDRTVVQENEGKSVCDNMLSPAEATTLNQPESLIYSTVNLNTKRKSGQIWDVSSPTTEHAIDRHNSNAVKAKKLC